MKNKKFNWLFVMMVALAAPLAFAGCSDDDGGSGGGGGNLPSCSYEFGDAESVQAANEGCGESKRCDVIASPDGEICGGGDTCEGSCVQNECTEDSECSDQADLYSEYPIDYTGVCTNGICTLSF